LQVVDVETLCVSFLGSTLKDHIKVWPEEADLSIVQSIKAFKSLQNLILAVESP